MKNYTLVYDSLSPSSPQIMVEESARVCRYIQECVRVNKPVKPEVIERLKDYDERIDL